MENLQLFFLRCFTLFSSGKIPNVTVGIPRKAGIFRAFVLRWRLYLAVIALLACTVSLLASTATANTKKQVIVTEFKGIISPVAVEHIRSAIDTAGKEGAEAIVIRLDTPGGLDTSMREIIKDIFNSRVPVIIHVAPPGARAASAGTFITLAAHVAVMAPGTNIGAAHPVDLSGSMPKKIEEKAVNDAAAYIRSIAKKTNRNESWAESAVRKSASITAEKALELNVIDYIAPDLKTLLLKLDGVSVETTSGSVKLQTKEADIADYPMSFRLRLLDIIVNPNVAYLLLALGFYALLYEFINPGIGLSGVGGSILLILGLYSLQVLPVNYMGLILILLGMALIAAEAFSPGFGVLGAGGIISMTAGSFLLFDAPIPALRVSPFLIAPTVLTTATLATIAVRAVLKTRKKKPITGMEAMIGTVGIVKRRLDPIGELFIRGERWRAESLEGTINEGEEAEIIDIEGLKLNVKRPAKNSKDERKI